MANDFAKFDYEEEVEEDQRELNNLNIPKNPPHNKPKRFNLEIPGRDNPENQSKGMNKLCKSVDCLNTLSSFVETRKSPELSNLFGAFFTEFTKTVEAQLLKSLQKMSADDL
jgi:hypothetical protein